MPGLDKQINDLQRAYQTLNVPTDATTISIKKAYRELLKRWHPDLNGNGGSPQADANQ
jgi:curved DNA-binding protein CbpA